MTTNLAVGLTEFEKSRQLSDELWKLVDFLLLETPENRGVAGDFILKNRLILQQALHFHACEMQDRELADTTT